MIFHVVFDTIYYSRKISDKEIEKILEAIDAKIDDKYIKIGLNGLKLDIDEIPSYIFLFSYCVTLFEQTQY